MRLFQDKEARYGYMDEYLDSYLGMQIRVLREGRGWTQTELGDRADMKQARISLLESMNYSDWSLDVLRRLAKAYDLRLVVKFEDFGSFLPEYFDEFDRQGLTRRPFEKDVVFSKKVRNSARTSLDKPRPEVRVEANTRADLWHFLRDKAVVPEISQPASAGAESGVPTVSDKRADSIQHVQLVEAV
jgi:transcriptional regulator with XRE-family HTH domain